MMMGVLVPSAVTGRLPARCGGSSRGRTRQQQTAHASAAGAAAANTAAHLQSRHPHHLHQQQQQQQQQEAALHKLASWATDSLAQQPTRAAWQPSDVVLDSTASTSVFLQQMAELRHEAAQLPTAVLVVLAGLAVNAAVVPNQLASSFGGAAPFADVSGADQHPWAAWRRAWAADMRRHHRLLSRYCSCSAQVDMRALEVSCHLAISSGVFNGGHGCWEAVGAGGSGGGRHGHDPSTQQQQQQAPAAAAGPAGRPYEQLLLELLQTRMQRVMADRLSGLASHHDAPLLARAAAACASDSSRHELALLAASRVLFEADPCGGLLAAAAVVRGGVMLPAASMHDGWHTSSSDSDSSAGGGGVSPPQLPGEAAAAAAAAPFTPAAASQLYMDFMAAADVTGVQTLNDVAAAVEECCRIWQVPQLLDALQTPPPEQRDAAAAAADADADAAAAASFLLNYPAELRRLKELQLEARLRARRRGVPRSASFSWVFKRDVLLA